MAWDYQRSGASGSSSQVLDRLDQSVDKTLAAKARASGPRNPDTVCLQLENGQRDVDDEECHDRRQRMAIDLRNQMQMIYAEENSLHTEILKLMARWADARLQLTAQSQATYGVEGTSDAPSVRTGLFHKSEQLGDSAFALDDALKVSNDAITADLNYARDAFTTEFNAVKVGLGIYLTPLPPPLDKGVRGLGAA
jgi:hypothetical protein